MSAEGKRSEAEKKKLIAAILLVCAVIGVLVVRSCLAIYEGANEAYLESGLDAALSAIQVEMLTDKELPPNTDVFTAPFWEVPKAIRYEKIAILRKEAVASDVETYRDMLSFAGAGVPMKVHALGGNGLIKSEPVPIGLGEAGDARYELVVTAIRIQAASVPVKTYSHFIDRSGPVIIEVLPGSKSEKLGLAAGDVIYRINKKPAPSSSTQFMKRLRSMPKGESFTVDVIRNHHDLIRSGPYKGGEKMGIVFVDLPVEAAH